MIRRLRVALLLAGFARPVVAQTQAPRWLIVTPTAAAADSLVAHHGPMIVRRLDGLTIVRVTGRADSMAVWEQRVVQWIAPNPKTGAPTVELDVPQPLHTVPPHDSGGNGRLLSVTLDPGLVQGGATRAWSFGARGQGVRVLYLDSGFGPNPHATILGGQNFDTGDSTDFSDNLAACDGHGTNTGSLIAGDSTTGVGMAPLAALYVGKVMTVFNGQCQSFLGDQLSGISYAVSHGYRLVSVSIGNSESLAYDNAVKSARAAGVLICGAMGNSGDSTLSDPGGAPGALGIGSVGTADQRSSWSSYGSWEFAVENGENRQGLAPGGGFNTKSGTSQATPTACGAVALVWSIAPQLSADSLATLMHATAKSLGNQLLYGAGLLQPDSAIKALIASGVPTVGTMATVGCQVSTLIAGLPSTCGGCTPIGDVSGTQPFHVIVDPSAPWLTATADLVHRQVCWNAKPPASALGQAPSITVVGGP